MPLKTSPARLRLEKAIHIYVHRRQKELTHKLKPRHSQFLVETLSQFVVDAISKYVKGDIEHGNSDMDFLDIDHLQEMANEVIDQLMYLAAARAKERRKKH